jgi:hypothetical protein
MPRYLVEHSVPHAGELTPPEIEDITQQCLVVLKKLESQMQWVHTTITENKIYCLCDAQDDKVVKEYARRCGLPIHLISKVFAIIETETVLNEQDKDNN